MAKHPINGDTPYGTAMRKAEKDLLVWALKQAEEDPLVAAARLGISRNFIYRRLRALEIPYWLPKQLRGRMDKETLARIDGALEGIDGALEGIDGALENTNNDNTSESDGVDDVASENAYEPTIPNQD